MVVLVVGQAVVVGEVVLVVGQAAVVVVGQAAVVAPLLADDQLPVPSTIQGSFPAEVDIALSRSTEVPYHRPLLRSHRR